MKALRLFVGVLASAGLLIVDAPIAQAGDGGGAQVVRAAEGCGVFVFDDDETIVGTVVGFLHITSAPNGIQVLTCRAELDVNPATRTVVVDGAGCSIGTTYTPKSHNVQTKSGQVTLTCQFTE